jgi:mRNA-capping enzyme
MKRSADEAAEEAPAPRCAEPEPEAVRCTRLGRAARPYAAHPPPPPPLTPPPLSPPPQAAALPESRLHDDGEADDDVDCFGLPLGWRECPPLGTPVWRFIPMKTPLLDHYLTGADAAAARFSVDDAKRGVDALLAGVTVPVSGGAPVPATCALVVDLTNSRRYCRAERWAELGVRWVKIPNRGRGEAPAPQAVNDFVWEAQCYLHANPGGHVLVHCTHGHNRSGYMIASALLRLAPDRFPSVAAALGAFTAARPPGIYKPFYVRHMYSYYHEAPAAGVLESIEAPAWKGGDSPDRGDGGAEEEAAAAAAAAGGGAVVPEHAHMAHDDPVGEAVCAAEAEFVRQVLRDEILGRGRAAPPFPGSQPVSLARSNLALLAERRYWVTWKADGTRYMVLLLRWGTYLVDRAGGVTRVQMRWPRRAAPPPGGGRPAAPFDPAPHHGTILDGEMVVDEDVAAGTRTRRFLAYDCVGVNGRSLAAAPWGRRWAAAGAEVEGPRRAEAGAPPPRGGAAGAPPRYDYATEPFRFRRKDFWPLGAAPRILSDFIPRQVAHEADGLIFQPHDDPYVPLTHHELLKWKFSHMNSVDFRLRVDAAPAPPAKKAKGGGGGVLDAAAAAPPRLALELLQPMSHGRAALVELTGPQSRVEFPGGERPEALAGRIVECAWDAGRGAWVFMRERRDKALPNAEPVYRKVWASICDDIQEEELLARVAAARKLPPYDEDEGRTPAARARAAEAAARAAARAAAAAPAAAPALAP